MEIKDILTQAVDMGASDIFIVAGAPLSYKINGIINAVFEDILSDDDCEKIVAAFYAYKNRSITKLTENGEDDFSFSLTNVGRFRVNTYMQRGSMSAVLRVVRYNLPDCKTLNIPDSILDFYKLQKGLVIVTGSSGSGKSTTLACIVDMINKNRNGHIITIEDPIEYLHKHQKCIVSQREVFSDTKDYLNALKSSLREAPDVIMIGEMRDLETIKIALSAAETGHLVLSSLHTMGAAETINRIIDVFPSDQQQQIRVQLAMTLQAVISQQLIPTVDNQQIPAYEIMMITNSIRTMIRDNKIHQVSNMIMSNHHQGMISMDDYLLELYNKGRITDTTLNEYASNYEMLHKHHMR